MADGNSFSKTIFENSFSTISQRRPINVKFGGMKKEIASRYRSRDQNCKNFEKSRWRMAASFVMAIGWLID